MNYELLFQAVSGAPAPEGYEEAFKATQDRIEAFRKLSIAKKESAKTEARKAMEEAAVREKAAWAKHED